MNIIFYPVKGDALTSSAQMGLMPSDLCHFDPNGKDLVRLLVSVFRDSLSVYDMSDDSQACKRMTIADLVLDLNSEHLNVGEQYCVYSTLKGEEIDDILTDFTADFVIVQGNGELLNFCDGELVCYALYDEAFQEVEDGEKCLCLYTDNKTAEVHVFDMRYPCKVGSFTLTSKEALDGDELAWKSEVSEKLPELLAKDICKRLNLDVKEG